ncbi:unnamed protein product [Lactuca saligna]|uniref:AAA+ ATPase domain-containing protein n=1 Tax=Lactuca saligna TaxID=75948 RepID=A0AA35VBX5_LACSI|nr:unnamed protein product [Lactuca saligna]
MFPGIFPVNHFICNEDTSSSDTLVKDITGSPPVVAFGLPSPPRRRHCFLHPCRHQTFFLLAIVLFFFPIAGILNSFGKSLRPGLFGYKVSRVLGGGLVPGSLILIGGDPGVGKSTLMLQIATIIAEGREIGKPALVLYVSGEESVEQIGNRADRMEIDTEELFLYSSTDIEDILEKAQALSPRALIIDSIQTVQLMGVTGSAGGNKSHFRVMFSVEVSSGYFSANLPAELTSTTELKLNNSNSNQWQPFLTFIEISRRFSLKAKAIRFRGTIEDCNTLLQQILYHGGEEGGVLTVSVNDMGWYGCYPEDCEEMMSAPLISEATINLIRKMHVDLMVAH